MLRICIIMIINIYNMCDIGSFTLQIVLRVDQVDTLSSVRTVIFPSPGTSGDVAGRTCLKMSSFESFNRKSRKSFFGPWTELGMSSVEN